MGAGAGTALGPVLGGGRAAIGESLLADRVKGR